MNDNMISEKALKKAAAQVRDAMLDEAMVLETEEHTFSPEFEKRLQQELPVKQRKKPAPAAVIMPVAAALALVVGLSCWMAGTTGTLPSDSGNTAVEDSQQTGADLIGDDNRLNVPENLQTVSYQFSVDGLVGSVALAQSSASGQTIEISGNSGTNAFGIASMWNEGVQ